MTVPSGGTYSLARVGFFHNSAVPTHRAESSSYARLLRALTSNEWNVASDGQPRSWYLFAEANLDSGDIAIEVDVAAALREAPASDVIVMDLRPPSGVSVSMTPARALYRVAAALRTYYAEGAVGHVLIVLPDLVDPDDLPYRAVSDLVESGEVSVVAETGYLWSSAEALVGQRSYSDRFALAANDQITELLREDPITLAAAVRLKTIRRLGYFPRTRSPSEEYGYNRYFYDGSHCVDELTTILVDEIRRLGGDGSVRVVYDFAVSTWFRPAVSAACTYTSSLSVSRDALVRLEPGAESPAAPVLLVTPLVQTQDSLKNMALAAREKYPNAALHAFAVYSQSGGEAEEGEGILATTVDVRLGGPGASTESLPLRYVQRIRQRFVRRTAMLPDVTFYSQRSLAFETERFVQLTADDFWTLALEHPMVEERDVPAAYRSQIACVPDFPKIVRANGPWLISKMDVASKRVARHGLREATLVTVAEEDGAVALAESVEALFGNRPIRVPREDLEEWRKQGRRAQLVDQWRNEGKSWAVSLDSVKRQNVVIIDEFAASGMTLDLLAELVASLGLRPRLLIGLAAMSRSKVDDTLGAWESLFLYETEVLTEKVV